MAKPVEPTTTGALWRHSLHLYYWEPACILTPNQLENVIFSELSRYLQNSSRGHTEENTLVSLKALGISVGCSPCLHACGQEKGAPWASATLSLWGGPHFSKSCRCVMGTLPTTRFQCMGGITPVNTSTLCSCCPLQCPVELLAELTQGPVIVLAVGRHICLLQRKLNSSILFICPPQGNSTVLINDPLYVRTLNYFTSEVK